MKAKFRKTAIGRCPVGINYWPVENVVIKFDYRERDYDQALTAADRPYKSAKPVSVAIDILHKMALDNHVDMDIFKLLLSSGIYLQYAERFLPAAQLDKIDIDKYLKQPVDNPA